MCTLRKVHTTRGCLGGRSSTSHPPQQQDAVHRELRPAHIEVMKSEINKYHAIVQSIKSLDERKDAKVMMMPFICSYRNNKYKDTFSLPEWWRCNSGALPHFSSVLRALRTNTPNSCPPVMMMMSCICELVFSMFNATFGEDQRSSVGDYLELAMQSQYNKRNLNL